MTNLLQAAKQVVSMRDDDLLYPAIDKLSQAIAQAEQQEPVAKAWDEGYRQGIEDERTSEANIGIAGFNAKVEPNRCNPYGDYTAPPQREWVEPSDEQIEKCLIGCESGFARAVLKLAKELNHD